MFSGLSDAVASESPMQVDEPDSTSQPAHPGIPHKATDYAFELLEAIIRPDSIDNRILPHVWLAINEALSHDTNLIGRLANKDDFVANVKNQGEQQFLDLLRKMAAEKSWKGLLYNDVFFQQDNPAQQLSQISEASVKAAVSAWAGPFKGKTADVLLQTISHYLDKKEDVYARYSCIVNSSGTGKSRMVDEMAMNIITVPMCLRHGSQGFPPPDLGLRFWFTSSLSQGFEQKPHGFLYALFTVLLKHLEIIQAEEGIVQPSKKASKNATAVTRRYKELAIAFHTRMTSGQSFEAVNQYRQNFYKEVTDLAEMFIRGSQKVPKANKASPGLRYTCRMGEDDENTTEGVEEAGKRLLKFIDKQDILNSNRQQQPLLILAFDEAQVLTNTPEHQQWTLFAELHRALREIVLLPIFSLFLSTAGSFHQFSPIIHSDPSSRIVNYNLRPLDPISEISFDDLAYPAKEYTVKLTQVTTMDWMAHLGRPLFGSYYDAPESNIGDLLLYAKQKLLNGLSMLDLDNGPGILACLSVRFGLEFNADEKSCSIACTQVERHMRLCVAATAGFERLITLSGSEPLLAEAAYELMDGREGDQVYYLANHSDLNCINHGRCGELVASLIIMQARDKSMSKNRWMSVSDFMGALLPLPVFNRLQNAHPNVFCEGDKQHTFNQIFKGYSMWFNHVIKVEDGKMIKAEHLWKFITRGAMIMCKDNQRGIDIVLPACIKDQTLSRDSVTAILIQVKNDLDYKCRIVKSLFDGLDPFDLGLFSNRLNPQPVIRLVFALASHDNGVLLREQGKRRYHDKFTAFDIWCAGLSSQTFRHIGDNLDSYQVLLQRSIQPHDAFTSKGTEGGVSRGQCRRRMAPLMMSEEEHSLIHQ